MVFSVLHSQKYIDSEKSACLELQICKNKFYKNFSPWVSRTALIQLVHKPSNFTKNDFFLFLPSSGGKLKSKLDKHLSTSRCYEIVSFSKCFQWLWDNFGDYPCKKFSSISLYLLELLSNNLLKWNQLVLNSKKCGLSSK